MKYIYLFIVAMLAVVVVGVSAFSGCFLFDGGGEPVVTHGPLAPGWQPVFVSQDIGASLDPREVVERITPTLVCITSEGQTDSFLPTPRRGAGSGIIIDPAGFIVTNSHVVEDASTLTVTLCDGRTVQTSEWVTDPEADIAVVVISAGSDLPYASFLSGSLSKLQVPEPVLAAGNALALPGGPTWTQGVVSHLGRPVQLSDDVYIEKSIQTSAAINPGNSGGPLINMAAQVVGINTAIAANAEGIGFAISTDTAIPVIERLIRG